MLHSTDLTIGHYILERLKQLGVKTLFGVPGDFNLGFLDVVEKDADIEWVGNCNELNAAYAADGYAMVKRPGVGVLLTTYGVGELSALNGISGSFAEMSPVVHIVGVPSRATLKNKPMIHHTLGDGRLDVYAQAARPFVAAQTILSDEETAVAEIDRVLTACVASRRPVYLGIPIDLAKAKIPGTGAQSLSTPLSSNIWHVNEDLHEEKLVADTIAKLIRKNLDGAAVLVDACAGRKGAKAETVEFVTRTCLPVYATCMGKGVVDEGYERYGGIYVGAFSRPEVRDAVENAKVVIHIGGLPTDFNTGIFSAKLPEGLVELHSTWTTILGTKFDGVGMKGLLPKLASALEPCSSDTRIKRPPTFKPAVTQIVGDDIKQRWFWPRMASFLRNKDIVVTETGTSSFGIFDVPFPDDTITVAQTLYGSIGYTIGATLGAATAGREEGRRTILFVGDGSLQVGVQELSTMIRTGVKPIIFVLNNAGYTIERCVMSPDRSALTVNRTWRAEELDSCSKFHDIQDWRWTCLLQDLGDPNSAQSKSYQVRTRDELSSLLDDDEFSAATRIQLVEVLMDKYDAPDLLVNIANAVVRTSHK
ncbi:pyruvate decarboxylase [Cylindrobasidium torrendii FP15055 ss-10]|uniref:Pyruvate decarboxylase n=1 Tax=Cylindrobasidium torrendii FP15055 ss-10 TaxID=1314674 RepID=A0A0D7BEX7_9AGAR|nr:pyruvate decarboxylase [Cylindrobasidium torrendii FP15055 ss-10]